MDDALIRVSTPDQAAIRRLALDHDLAWRAGDVKALAGCYTDDAIVLDSGGRSAAGRLELVRELGGFLRGPGRGSRLVSRIERISFVSPDVAIVDGEANVTGLRRAVGGEARSLRAGREGTTLVRRFTAVAVRRRAGWRIAQVRACMWADRAAVDRAAGKAGRVADGLERERGPRAGGAQSSGPPADHLI